MAKPKSKVRGSTARGNLSWLALLRPLEALMMSISTLASRPALTPIAMTSEVATSAVAARRLFASLAVWARPGFSPVWKSLPNTFRIGSTSWQVWLGARHHDGERAGLGAGDAAAHRGIDPADLAFGELGRHLGGHARPGGRQVDHGAHASSR